MDAATIFAQFGPWGLALVLVIGGMRWVVKRLDTADKLAQARVVESQARCDAERAAMAAKLDKLEERIADVYEDTINKSTAAMAATVDTLKRFCDIMDRRS